MRFFYFCAALLVSFPVTAFDGYPYPGTDIDGKVCFSGVDETPQSCKDRWMPMNNISGNEYYDQVMYCPSRGQYCFTVADGFGCGCHGDPAPKGWELPASLQNKVDAAASYRDEIMEQVVRACYKPQAENVARESSMTTDQVIDFAIALAQDTINEMISTLTSIVETMPDRADRQVIYEVGKSSCLKGIQLGMQ